MSSISCSCWEMKGQRGQYFGMKNSSQKKLVPTQYFFISHASYHAPYCTPYCKVFIFICLQISYDLIYLNLFVMTNFFCSADNILLYVRGQYIESQSICNLSILAKVCVCVFIKILSMATICFSYQSRYCNKIIIPSKRTKT